MWLTYSFMLIALQMLIFNTFTYFEDYVPSFILRTVRYGRSGVGIQSKPILFDVPKRWFTHFYIFASTWVTLILYSYIYHQALLHDILTWFWGFPVCVPDSVALFASSLFAIQIYRRLYECLFVNKFSSEAKMNAVIYFIGFWHYFGAIISIFGGSRGCAAPNLIYACAALPIFVFGWVKQYEAHKILASLRTSSSDQSYKIPMGGLFKYVSCGNYLAELLIYLSLCMLFGFGNYELNWVAIWVLSNQVYAAAMSHKWYLNKFGSTYPKDRKRLIPFIF